MAGTLRRLAREHGTPLLVVRRRQIERNHRTLRRLLPRVKIYYAMKANPDPHVVRTILDDGGCVEVCSRAELDVCAEAGAAPQRILYTHPVKTADDIRRARAFGLDLFVADNRAELDKLAAVAAGTGVLLRVRVANPFCLINLSEKYGCAVEDVEPLARAALDLGLRPRGICFHVGSQTTSAIPYVQTLETLRQICDRLADAGIELDLLDIGGGFPLTHGPEISVEELCGPIAAAIERQFASFDVLCEPGRFLVGNSAILITSVIGKSVRDGVIWYYIDDGLYATFSGRVFDKAEYPLFAERPGPRVACVVAGPTCDSFDVVSTDRSLPEQEVGDLIWATNIGAYSMASGSRFNGFGPARVLFIEKEHDDDFRLA